MSFCRGQHHVDLAAQHQDVADWAGEAPAATEAGEALLQLRASSGGFGGYGRQKLE